MGIPGYQEIMRPLLVLISDGQEHSIREAYEKLADHFELTEEERNELLPSGSQYMFDNRVGWAKFQLKKFGLIEDMKKRGIFKITDLGMKEFREGPEEITTKYMKEKYSGGNGGNGPEPPPQEIPPDEMIEQGHKLLSDELIKEILQQIKSQEPSFLEQLVVDLMLAMGYGGSRKDAGKAIGKTGDGGVDGIIKEDRLGLDVVYLQAKRWEGPVGKPAVQAFAGSLEGFKANKGVMITTSQFSSGAQDYVKDISKKIILIDGERLAQLMIEHNIGVTPIHNYETKKLDTDYFEEK